MNCHRAGVSVTASGNLCVLCGLLGSEPGCPLPSRPSVSEPVEVRLRTFPAFFTGAERGGPPGSILQQSLAGISPSSGLPRAAAKVVMRGPGDLVTRRQLPLLCGFMNSHCPGPSGARNPYVN